MSHILSAVRSYFKRHRPIKRSERTISSSQELFQEGGSRQVLLSLYVLSWILCRLMTSFTEGGPSVMEVLWQPPPCGYHWPKQILSRGNQSWDGISENGPVLRMSSYDCLSKCAGLLGAVSHKSLEKIPFLRIPSKSELLLRRLACVIRVPGMVNGSRNIVNSRARLDPP